MLPGRKSLAREYGVALNTLQAAIEPLVAEGILHADPRRGTFVAQGIGGAQAEDSLFAGSRDNGGIRSRPLSGSIGIVGTMDEAPHAPSKDGRYYSSWPGFVLRTLESELSAHGLSARWLNTWGNDAYPSKADAVASFLREGVSGVAALELFSSPSEERRRIVRSLQQAGCPVVYVAPHASTPYPPCVFYDQRLAGHIAGQHLLRSGYTRLAFCALGEGEWIAERIQGVRDAIKEADLNPRAISVVNMSADQGDSEYEASRRTAEKAASQGSPIWASQEGQSVGIVASNDPVALGLLAAAEAYGSLPARDFGLVGFDDCPSARTAGLTSLRPPFESLAHMAAQILLSGLQGKPVNGRIRLGHELIVRNSSARSSDGCGPIVAARRV